MEYKVSNITSEYDFSICGASYAGNPKDNTMMYITKKVEYLLTNLSGRKNCLVFVENGMQVNAELKRDNYFIFSDNAQFEYAKIASDFSNMQREIEKSLKYQLTEEGYYIGKNVKIGDNSYIEPGVLIGHNVSIGKNAVIMAGAVIKHAVIGDNFVCNENAVIGDYSFTMAEDNEGNKFRVPSLGRVVIGNNVEIGACDDIAQGACGDTTIEDYVKIDALVHIGHEAYLCKNSVITAGAIVGGFVKMAEHSYLGINSSIRNRISLGNNCIIGMGTNVTKSVEANYTVVGNPAKPMRK